ncbi:MAG: ABC-three component system protein [Sulfurimonas sp.]|jgi:hypothetical protein
MGDKARDYKLTTVKRLFALSGNECCSPNCTRNLVAEDEKTIVAKICHIEAASPNGPRYNQNMSDDDRRDFKNLLLLCDEHHEIIDNPLNEIDYPKEFLFEWKRSHENKLLNKKMTHSTLLSQAVSVLSNLDSSDDNDYNEQSNNTSFNIDKKIDHNHIQEYKYLIEEYKVYSGKIDSLYNELEKSGSFKKEKLLKKIRNLYLRVKGEYTAGSENELDTIQKYSDKIIEKVENYLFEEIENTGTSTNDDALIAVPIIMVDAFMRCKILEKPIS